ncbi:type II toxin-antitoxin system HicB family antitoxin [Acidobacteriota bacterium]
MPENLTIEYWEDGSCFVGRIVEHPEIVAYGKSLEEMEANLQKAFLEFRKKGAPSLKERE